MMSANPSVTDFTAAYEVSPSACQGPPVDPQTQPPRLRRAPVRGAAPDGRVVPLVSGGAAG
jgi:hypothetical protein